MHEHAHARAHTNMHTEISRNATLEFAETIKGLGLVRGAYYKWRQHKDEARRCLRASAHLVTNRPGRERPQASEDCERQGDSECEIEEQKGCKVTDEKVCLR